MTENRLYDLQGRLLNQSLGGTEQTAFRYDAESNLLTRNSTIFTHSYQYDPLNRLTRESNDQSDPIDYLYDPNGNRTAKQQPQQTNLYEYTPNSNRLETIDNQIVQQDAAGNVTLDAQGRSFVYNQAGRLAEIRVNGTLIAGYRYNAFGQRTHKILPTETIHYHYGLNGNLIAESRSDGSLIRDYIRLMDEPVARIDIDVTGETLHFLHTDHLNTPRLATDANRSVVWRWEGEAFGNTGAQSFGAVVNLRFPGQYFDDESGLHYNYFRYYDPKTGRYITSDPIGLQGGFNTYGYSLQNPITLTDPTGNFANVAVGIGIRVLGGRAAGVAIGTGLRRFLGKRVAKYASCFLIGYCSDILSELDDSLDNTKDDSDKCSNEDDCFKYYEDDLDNCDEKYGPPLKGPLFESLLRACREHAFRRYSACLNGQPDPGPFTDANGHGHPNPPKFRKKKEWKFK